MQVVQDEMIEGEAPPVTTEASMILAALQEEQASLQKSEPAPQVEAPEEHKQSLGSQR